METACSAARSARLGHLAWIFAAIGSPIAGCSATDTDGADALAPASIRQAVSSQEDASIIGFEDPSQWAPTSGAVAAASVHQAGQGALAVTGGGYRGLVSNPLGSLDLLDDSLTLSLRLPAQQPNPYWYGQIQLMLDLPSRGLSNRWIGAVELT